MSTNAITSEPKSLRREHNVVSQEEWIAARKDLLEKEKESTRLRDQLSAERRKLPWVKIEKNYVFDGPDGKVTLADSTYGRGLEPLVGTYMILDLVPKGRDEDQLSFPMEWARHHDRYGTDEFADANKPYWSKTASPSSATCG